MEDFKGITQEMADELLEALEDFNKFVEYMYKYADGTFLTRWYWLRKARKCNEALKGIIQFNEEHFKHE